MAASPASQALIGRVAVKILPDTADFRKSAERELNAIEKSLKDMTVKIAVEFDEGNVINQARTLRERAQQAMKDLKLNVDLNDQTGLQRAIQRVQSELARLRETTISVGLDKDSLEKELARLKDRLKQIETFDLRVNPSSIKSMESALSKINQELDKRKEMEVSIRTETSSLEAAAEEIRARLERARTLDVRIDPKSVPSMTAALAKVDAELAKRREMQVKIQMDRASLEQTADELRRRVAEAARFELTVDPSSNSSLTNALGKIEAELARMKELAVNVRPDRVSLERTAEELRKRLDEAARFELRIDPKSLDSIESAIEKIEDELGGRKGMSLKVRPDSASMASTLAELKKLSEKLKDEAEKNARLELSIDPKSAASVEAALKAVNKELEARKELRLAVKLDTGSLEATAKELQKRIDDAARLKLEIDPKSKSSLNAAIKEIEDKLAEKKELKVEVKTDSASLTATLAELKSKLRAQVDIDNEAFGKSMDNARKVASEKLANIKVTSVVDRAALDATRREIEDTVLKIDNLRASIKPEMSAEAKHKVEREIDDLQDKIDKLTSEIQPEVSEASRLLTMASLAWLTRDRIVTIIPTVSLTGLAGAATAIQALSGARVLGDIFENITNRLKELDRSVPIVGTIALAVAGLAGWGATAASNLFALSASLAQIGPAALLLPGILGGMAIGVGVMVAALKDFNTIFPDVKAALSSMQDTISTNFWAEAQQPMREMIDHMLPQFAAGFAKASTELGGFFAGITTAFKTSFDGPLAGMFEDLGASIDIATGATGPLVSIMEILGTLGASYLPRLAQWFVDITTNFEAFLSKARASGELTEWVEVALENLKALGNVLKETGRIFVGLGKAAIAGGGAGLTTLADTLKSIADTVNGPTFQTLLTSLFAGAHEAMSNIAKVSGPAVERMFIAIAATAAAILPTVGNTIGKIAETIATVFGSPEVQRGLTDLFQGISLGIAGLAPAVSSLGPLLGTLGTVIGVFAAGLGPLLGAAISALAPVLDSLLQALSPIAAILMGALTQAITFVSPLFLSLADSIGGLVGPITSLIGPALSGLSDFFDTIFSGGDGGGSGGPFGGILSGLNELVPALSDLGNVGLESVVSLFDTLINSGADLALALGSMLPGAIGLIAALLPVVTEAFRLFFGAVSQVVTILAGGLAAIMPTISAAIATIMPVLVPLIESLLDFAVNVIGQLVANLVPFIQEHLPQLALAFANLIAAIQPVLDVLIPVAEFLVGILIPAFLALTGTLIDTVVAAINLVAQVFESAIGIIMGVWEVFKGVFTGDWQGAWDGIKLIFTSVFDLIGAFISLWWTTVQGMFNGALGAILGIVQSVLSSIASFFTGTLDTLGSAWSNTWGTMLSTVQSIFSTIASVVSGAVSSLVSSVSGMVGTIVSTIAGLPGQIIGLAGQMLEAGSTFMSNFLQGLSAGLSAVGGFATDVAGAIWGAIKGFINTNLLFPIKNYKFEIDIGPYERTFQPFGSIPTLAKGATILPSPGGTLVNVAEAGKAETVVDTGKMNRLIDRALANPDGGGGSGKSFTYVAAPNNSISSEEELFAASRRARFEF